MLISAESFEVISKLTLSVISQITLAVTLFTALFTSSSVTLSILSVTAYVNLTESTQLRHFDFNVDADANLVINSITFLIILTLIMIYIQCLHR